MNPEIVYYKIKEKSTIREDLLKYAKDYSDWGKYEELNHVFIDSAYFYETFVKNDVFLSKLYKKLPFNGALIHNKPFTVFDWHTDIGANRLTALNMELTIDHHSHTLFSLDRKKVYERACTFVEIEYKPDTYYLLNSAHIDHIVTNFAVDRMLLSITFHDTKISYFDALGVIMEIDQ